MRKTKRKNATVVAKLNRRASYVRSFLSTGMALLVAIVAVPLLFLGCKVASEPAPTTPPPTPTPDTTAPPAVTLTVAAGTSNDSVVLTWTDPADPDFSHVLLSWTPMDGNEKQPLRVNKGTETRTITGLLSKSYSFSAVSVDIAGNRSGPSDDGDGVWATTCVAPDAQKLYFPQVNIDTGGRAIEDIDKVAASFSLTIPDEATNGTLAPCHAADVATAFVPANSSIGIEIRGESSQFVHKKNYDIETRDAAGDNNNISILGLPEENDWILSGTAYERTYTNNVLAYAIYRDIIGGHYAPRTCYVELTLNNDYRGVYVLTEQIKRDRNRVDIKKLDSDETTGRDLTGGYIFSMDKDVENNEAYFTIPRTPNDASSTAEYAFQHVYPDGDDIVTEQVSYITDYMRNIALQLDLAETDDDIDIGTHVDVTSLADMVILNELSYNTDAYAISSFYYKDREDESTRLFFGPPWDYDLAYGTIRSETNVPTNMLKIPEVTWSIYSKFWRNPAMRAEIQRRYRELRAGALTNATLLRLYDDYADQLVRSDAIYRDYRRWHGFADPCLAFDQLLSLKKAWLVERLAWLDSQWM